MRLFSSFFVWSFVGIVYTFKSITYFWRSKPRICSEYKEYPNFKSWNNENETIMSLENIKLKYFLFQIFNWGRSCELC